MAVGIKGGSHIFHVGQVVEVLSERSVGWNYLLYITQVNSSGFGDGLVSGYWMYKSQDLRRIQGCGSARVQQKEVFLTREFHRVSLSCVLHVMDVRPEFMRTGSEDFWYGRFFDHHNLVMRSIDFELCSHPVRALDILTTDWLGMSGEGVFIRRELANRVLRRLEQHCEKRDTPTVWGGLRLKMELPFECCMHCLAS